MTERNPDAAMQIERVAAVLADLVTVLDGLAMHLRMPTVTSPKAVASAAEGLEIIAAELRRLARAAATHTATHTQ
jgi:hypothetical protein